MTLVVAYTPAEKLLMRGPAPLPVYEGESFSWVQALMRRPCDWNTLLTLPMQPKCLANIANFFLAPLPAEPAGGDAHSRIRRAAEFLMRLAELMATAELLVSDSKKIHIASLCMFNIDIVENSRGDSRTQQEWMAWFSELLLLIAQERQIMERMRGRIKRRAADAELDESNRAAPVAVPDAGAAPAAPPSPVAVSDD